MTGEACGAKSEQLSCIHTSLSNVMPLSFVFHDEYERHDPHYRSGGPSQLQLLCRGGTGGNLVVMQGPVLATVPQISSSL